MASLLKKNLKRKKYQQFNMDETVSQCQLMQHLLSKETQEVASVFQKTATCYITQYIQQWNCQHKLVRESPFFQWPIISKLWESKKLLTKISPSVPLIGWGNMVGVRKICQGHSQSEAEWGQVMGEENNTGNWNNRLSKPWLGIYF